MVTKVDPRHPLIPAVLDRAPSFYLVWAIPLYILSQWTALKLGLPFRQPFNVLSLTVVAGVLIMRRKDVLRFRAEASIAMIFGTVVVASAVVNKVPPNILVRGTLPYLVFGAAALAVLVVRLESSLIDRAVKVTAVTAALSVVATLIQAVFGEVGFVITGQDLSYPQWWNLGRTVGLVANPGGYAQLGVLWIVIAATGRGTATTRAILALSGGIAIGLGVSRTFLFVAILLAIIWIVARHVAGSTWLAWGALAAIGAFVVVQVFIPAARSNLIDRSETLVLEAGESGAEAEAIVNNTRMAGIRAVRRLLTDHPFLGVGPGQFGSATAFRYQSLAHETYNLPVPMASQLDVGWAQVAGETGFLGLVASIALLIALAYRAIIRRSVAAFAIVVLLAVSTLSGPGITNIAFVVVALWWFAAAMRTDDEAPDVVNA